MISAAVRDQDCRPQCLLWPASCKRLRPRNSRPTPRDALTRTLSPPAWTQFIHAPASPLLRGCGRLVAAPSSRASGPTSTSSLARPPRRPPRVLSLAESRPWNPPRSSGPNFEQWSRALGDAAPRFRGHGQDREGGAHRDNPVAFVQSFTTDAGLGQPPIPGRRIRVSATSDATSPARTPGGMLGPRPAARSWCFLRTCDAREPAKLETLPCSASSPKRTPDFSVAQVCRFHHLLPRPGHDRRFAPGRPCRESSLRLRTPLRPRRSRAFFRGGRCRCS